MTDTTPKGRDANPPARQLRLLANVAPAATVLFGALTVWLVVTTLRNLALPMSSLVVLSLVLGIVAAVLAGLATYRLGIEVPRTLRSWQTALAERRQVLRDK